MQSINNQITKSNKSATSTTLIDSSLSLDRVFNGNYWDDFSLPLFMRSNIHTVLMLGVGYGAGIRPMLLAQSNLEITGVDIDADANDICTYLFTKYFGIKPNLVTCDANDFLICNNKKFDLIWIDLYDNEGPLKNMFTIEFWKRIKNNLALNGLVAINIYGIANHLEPFLDDSPLKTVTNLAATYFKEVTTIPHRRNITLIASDTAFESIQPQTSRESDPLEQLTLQFQSQRAYFAGKTTKNLVEASINQVPSIEFTFQTLNSLQQKAWGHYLYELNGLIAKQLEIQFMSPNSLVSYLKNEFTGRLLINTLRGIKSELIIMIPTFLGADIHNHNDSLDWYLEYLSRNGRIMKNDNPLVWQKYFLPQWVSMLNAREELRTSENFKKVTVCHE